MSSLEIEIKSLLGNKDRAESLTAKMQKLDPNSKLVDESKQLNHYFTKGNLKKLLELARPLFSKDIAKNLENIITKGESISVRTREANGDVRLVLKASIGDDTSANGVSRMEFEEGVKDLTIDELDRLVLDAGFEYEAKWSRERKEYSCNNANVCIDKNAGYGYLAEFEKVVDEDALHTEVENELRSLMNELECEELAQDRLERMFAYYNENWPDYYGTDNVFVIL